MLEVIQDEEYASAFESFEELLGDRNHRLGLQAHRSSSGQRNNYHAVAGVRSSPRAMGVPDREPLLRRIVQELRSDPRVAAAWLTGSIGRHEDDAWSDLDLHVAVDDEHLTAFWRDREALYERLGQLVLVQGEMQSNAQEGAHFQLVVFDGPLEVDWNVGPLSLTTRAPAHVVLFARGEVPLAAFPDLSADELREQCDERLVFLWAMTPIAVKYIARAQTDRAVRQIGLVRNAFIALWRLLETGHSTINGMNQPLEPALSQMLPRFGSTIDAASCLAVLGALCDSTVELHPHLEALGVSVPEQMPAEVARLTAEARAAGHMTPSVAGPGRRDGAAGFAHVVGR